MKQKPTFKPITIGKAIRIRALVCLHKSASALSGGMLVVCLIQWLFSFTVVPITFYAPFLGAIVSTMFFVLVAIEGRGMIKK